MKKHFLFILFYFTFCFILNANAQISGCTDPQSTNYNPLATVNDGSCTYNATSLTLTEKTPLSTPLINESSGLTFLDGKLWTFNDSGNPADIYRVDSVSNTVFQTVHVSNATNVDWEDMTSNNDYLFVGDFGNNNGNRQDLKIYRINKLDLTTNATSVTAAVINFSFSDQTSFPSLPNNNNFDCESMIFLNDSIHLFSKDWVDLKTRHYVLPNSPGTHVAQYRETYNAGFLVTSASVQKLGVISLIGYIKTGTRPVSMCMLYDYKNNLLFNGNKRTFDLSTELINGQVEGVEFFNNSLAYISNELFTSGATVPPKLKTFDLTSYLPVAFLSSAPAANFTANNTTICSNAFITFTDQSTNVPTSWQWSFTGGTPSTSTLQNPLVQYLAAGTYSVTLIAGNGAGSNTIVKTNYITVNAFPSATITANGLLNFCSGGSVLISANTGVGLTYQWKNSAGNIAGQTSSAYTATTSETYMCVVTNSNSCSAVSNSIAVAVNTLPTATITPSGATTFCSGSSVNLTASVNSSYLWSTGSTNQTITATTGGNYAVTVTGANGCIQSSSPTSIVVYALPSASITANGPLNFCTGGSVLFFANVGTGLSYQWKKGNAFISGVTASTYSATGTGIYKAVITNQNGCSKTSNSISVTGPPAVTITTIGSLNLCPSDSVKFTVTLASGNLYQWKKNNIAIAGATSNYYYASTAGAYKVNVTNSFGCSKFSGIKTVTTNCRFENVALQSNDNIKIYPNPSSEYFNIALNKNSSCEIIIFDLMGKQIENHEIINTESFRVGENLQPGFYLCEIIFENKKAIYKIIKSAE